MRNIKLTIEYDGTNYHGWQSQLNARAIQDVVASAINKLTGENVNLIGAGRTDTGVHAYGQVANFMTDSAIPSDKFLFALNSVLPKDIVVSSSEEAAPDFHSRFSAKGKRYRYLIYNSECPSALLRNRSWHVSVPLKLQAMQRAAQMLLGEHDFSSFMSSGSSVISTVREINDVSVTQKDKLITLEIEGNGFLYNMVRIIAGTLVYVGKGRIQADEIEKIINSHDRREAGITAPAHGLYLVSVLY